MAGELPTIQRPSWVDRIPRIHFLDLFEKYRRRIVHRETELPFEPTRDGETPYTIERLAFGAGKLLRLSLKLFTPFALLLFGFSFIWDFYGVIRSCSVAGLIGFGTNWVAIKMLFWPKESRPIFGHGLIPAQRDQLIEKVANEVLGKLINEELILRQIEDSRLVSRFTDATIAKLRTVTRDPEFQEDLRNMILTYVGRVASDLKFREELTRIAENRVAEFAGTPFRNWLFSKLKDLWRAPVIDALNQEIERLEETADGGLRHMDGVLERLPQALETRQEQIDRVLTKMLLGLVREVDIRAIVLKQLSTVTSDDLEKAFREFSDDKLAFITILGGILGIVGGPIIIWPVETFVVLTLAAVVLTVLDFALYPLMRSHRWPKKEVAPGAPPPGDDRAAPLSAPAGSPEPLAAAAPAAAPPAPVGVAPAVTSPPAPLPRAFPAAAIRKGTEASEGSSLI